MRPTPAVHLRPLTAADALTIGSWAMDELFCRRAEWEPGRVREYYVDFHRRIILDPPAQLLRLGVVEAGSGGLAGLVDLHGCSRRSRELGYVIGPSSNWGRGLGGAAAGAGLAHGFGLLHLQHIWAEAAASNRASVRILESLSMRETTDAGQRHPDPGMRRFEITADTFASRVVT